MFHDFSPDSRRHGDLLTPNTAKATAIYETFRGSLDVSNQGRKKYICTALRAIKSQTHYDTTITTTSSCLQPKNVDNWKRTLGKTQAQDKGHTNMHASWKRGEEQGGTRAFLWRDSRSSVRKTLPGSVGFQNAEDGVRFPRGALSCLTEVSQAALIREVGRREICDHRGVQVYYLPVP